MKRRRVGSAVLAASIGLLVLAPVAQAEVRVSPNYRLNDDPGPFRGQDQVGLATNPANPQHVVAVHANHLDSTCDASASFDGGTTWSPAFPLTNPAATSGQQPFLKSCTTGAGTSQYVQFGTGRNVYTTTTAQRAGPGFSQDPTVLVNRSTDGGLTWRPGVVAMPGGPGSLDFTSSPNWNRPAIAVDPGAGQGGADRIHVVALEQLGRICGTGTPPPRCRPLNAVVSNDGGQSFSGLVDVTPLTTNVTDFPSRPVVNADHSVTVAWRTTAVDALIQVARWNPGTQQWGAPIDVTRVRNTGTSTATHVPPNPPTQGAGASTSASYPRLAGGASGRVYLVYSQGVGGPTAPAGGYQGADHFISPTSQVWFQRSTDGGATWSTPKQVSGEVTLPGSRTHQTRHPSVSVSPGGRINVVWHDRRHWFQGPGERNCTHSHIFCEEIRLGDTYYSYSTNGGDSFSSPLRITDRSYNSDVGYDTRPSGYWWFSPQSVTIGGGRELVGWMDSRHGNWDTDTQDIFLAKVDLNASGPAPKTHVDAPNAVERSVALSKLGYLGGNEGALVGGPRDPANPAGCTTAACPTGPASRNASSVVIVNEGDVASALAGSVLGRANPAAVLLSPASGLPASVKAEVSRIAPAGAFVIGDASKLSPQVVSDLQRAGVPASGVTRIQGGSAAIAAAIATRLDYRTQVEKDANAPAFDAAVIANPASPDAAAAAGLAAARRLPFLFVDSNSIPPETQAALDSLDIDKTLVIGGPAVVSDTVRGQVPGALRLGGADQYQTSNAVVAESRARGLPSNVVYVADGSRPMDGALLGGAVARATGMMLLAHAPLHTTATGQTAGFGLGGADRFVLVGPPVRTASPSPAPVRATPLAAFAGCPTSTSHVIRGTAASNSIMGTAGADRIFAGSGNDRVDGRAADDCIELGAGRDRGEGGTGDDLLLGGVGRDRIVGERGDDRLRGGPSADRISGGSGNDSITGNAGGDRLKGARGRDRLSGGSGNDTINARDRRRDRVSCGSGRDRVLADRIDRVTRSCERVRRRR